jgi:Replication-relaxation
MTNLRDRSPILPLAERERAAMRLLGRLGTIKGQTLETLVFRDQSGASRRRILRGLAERKLLWQATAPNASADGRLQGRPPCVYGLTDDGLRMLDSFGAEPHDGTFERLIARSKQAPTAPLSSQLHSDTYISDWCASLLDHIRRTPLLAGIEIQRRYALVGADGTLLQTIGALITLAFDPNQRTFSEPVWTLPWLTDGAISPSWRIVRLAVEVDINAMSPRTLFEMAQTYQRLSGDGTYQRLLGGPLRPVIITPPERRVRAVAEIWMGAWPGSPALISTFKRTEHPVYGALWGEYMALKTNPMQLAPLLGTLMGTVEQWPAKVASWPGSARGSLPSSVTRAARDTHDHP